MSTRFAVDLAVCQNIGQCSFTAPELFPLDDDGTLAFRARAEREYVSEPLDAGSDDVELAEAAVTLCPMQAIRLEEN
jgi:ferredoxin